MISEFSDRRTIVLSTGSDSLHYLTLKTWSNVVMVKRGQTLVSPCTRSRVQSWSQFSLLPGAGVRSVGGPGESVRLGGVQRRDAGGGRSGVPRAPSHPRLPQPRLRRHVRARDGGEAPGRRQDQRGEKQGTEPNQRLLTRLMNC